MKKTYQITEAGKADLEKELAELKGRRGEIAEKIAAARDFGDLSENAEYDAAREEQGLVETRILKIFCRTPKLLNPAAAQALAWVAQSNCNAQKELYLTRWLGQLKPIRWLDESQISRQLVKN